MVKNLLSAIAVAAFGFILLNITFLFDFLFHSFVIKIMKLFITINDPAMDFSWFSPLMHISFMVIICLISWYIFRSKLGVLYKAIYLTVPTAVILATLGIFLYRWPIAVYTLGSVLTVGTLYYFYRTKQPWIYYYAVILVSCTLAIFTLLGGEI